MTDKSDKKPPSPAKSRASDPSATMSVPPDTPASKSENAPPAEFQTNMRRIQIGDVLNHIFEVRQFIARGGMGEVFEGINVSSEERVAIKVILPHLAADPSIQTMFRKEARTLTRLSHPALVQYRVLANEPQLGALYIVTEFIDGPTLSDQLTKVAVSSDELIQLMRKLAEGLAAAHMLGAIHRDVSPDNVLLEHGRIDHPKIIDFGIAKDLQSTAQTVIGDGFAGKLAYVAPEQLGDFDRKIGPWTDVYSLGLTIMAVALGRNVNLGRTLVEAVERRRTGFDLSDAPEQLRPLLQRMLQADPAQRPQSMHEVLTALDALSATSPTAAGASGAGKGLGGATTGLRALLASGKGKALAAGAVLLGVALVLALAVGLPTRQTRREVVASPPPQQKRPQQQQSPSSDPLSTARRAVVAELPSVPCSWLNITDARMQGSRLLLSLRGVSGQANEARARLGRVLQAAGISDFALDLSDVSPISTTTCSPIEAFVRIKAAGPNRLAVAQRRFEMARLPRSDGADAGKKGAEAVFTLDLAGFPDDLSLVGIDEAGEIAQLAPTRTDVIAHSQKIGPDRYRFSFVTTHSGWSGILMLTGKGPFDPGLLNAGGSHGEAWAQKFLEMAGERGWAAEMVWYRTVDERAD